MADGPDVVVVGAGTSGLALACGLLAGGVSVRVLDAASGPATTSRALGLQPRGAEVIDRLGALGGLPDRSVAIRRVAVHVNGREAATLRLGRPTRLVKRPGLLVSQAEIEAALRARLSELGGAVEWGREVVAAEQSGSGVVVEALTPARGGPAECIETSWLVGCDGAHSRVRKLAGIAFPGVALIERFLLADVHADLPIPRDGVSVWLRGEEMFGAFPLPGQDLWRLMAPVEPLPATAVGADAGASASPQVRSQRPTDGVLDELRRLLYEHTGTPAAAVRDAEWTSTFRVHRRLATTYRRGRILLAGDAAHIHSPLGGQGMNTGLGDAENLAWKLVLVARGLADGSLLDTYQTERRPVAADVLSSTSTMTRVVLGDNGVARRIRDWVFVPLMDRSLVQRLIWERASQLTISYRSGPLGRLPHSPRVFTLSGRLRPGDRVPDVACRRTDGTRTRLHAELGGRWALLRSRADAPADAAVVAQLGSDLVSSLEPAGSELQEVMLVRPDGHLAWASRRATDGPGEWLQQVLKTGGS